MDDADRADGNIDRSLQDALRIARTAPPAQQGNGYCWHCDQDWDDLRRWCDADCRDAWEQNRRKVSPRAG